MPALTPLQQRALEIFNAITPKTIDKSVRRGTALLPTQAPCAWGDMPTELGQNWAFDLQTCFLDALDTRLTEKVVDSVKRKHWTQGANFSFAVGYGLTTSPEQPKYFVQIHGARAAVSAHIQKEKWTEWPKNLAKIIAQKEGLTVWQTTRKPTKDDPSTCILHTSIPRDSGLVSGVLYTSSTGKTLWAAKQAFTTTQDDFVRFLITGHIDCLSIYK